MREGTEISMPSTGDRLADERALTRFMESTALLNSNCCPNGCGPLNWLDPHNRECPVCHFAAFSNVPYDMKGGNA